MCVSLAPLPSLFGWGLPLQNQTNPSPRLSSAAQSAALINQALRDLSLEPSVCPAPSAAAHVRRTAGGARAFLPAAAACWVGACHVRPFNDAPRPHHCAAPPCTVCKRICLYEQSHYWRLGDGPGADSSTHRQLVSRTQHENASRRRRVCSAAPDAHRCSSKKRIAIKDPRPRLHSATKHSNIQSNLEHHCSHKALSLSQRVFASRSSLIARKQFSDFKGRVLRPRPSLEPHCPL